MASDISSLITTTDAEKMYTSQIYHIKEPLNTLGKEAILPLELKPNADEN